MVVIGGPGAGKSTLCQRTAYRLARSGKWVLRVRLSSVAQRCFSGSETIDEALLSVAAAGSSIQPEMLVGILNELDCLLADGLDECGGYCTAMAEQLRTWASARPRTRVIVTTRPIGYDQASFESWQHVELLPLDSNHIEDHARSILNHIEPDPSRLARKIQQFQSQIKINQVASMAARSPLLLGFLIQLTHHSIPFAQRRAALYEQVLALWYKTPPKDRSVITPESGISFTYEVFNRVGWHLQQPSLQPAKRSKQGVIDALASQLCEQSQNLLATKEKIEHCLTFWQERGVLELLQVGHEDAYTFVHATLGEYAAGRHIAAWDDHTIRAFLEHAWDDAHWREPLLLAAGVGKANVIVEHLLSLEQEKDPVATESLLAAAALAEAAHPPPALTINVAERIVNRLCSTIPAVAYESAQHSLGLAAQLAERMESLLHPLFSHPQQWTRLAALRLSLAAGDTVVDFSALEASFDEWSVPIDSSEPGESAPPKTTQEMRKSILGRHEPWNTWNEVLALGAEALVRVRPGEATVRRLERLAHLRSGISGHTSQVLLQQLERLGCFDLVAKIRKEYTAALSIHWDTVFEEQRRADQALLEAVLRVTGTVAYPEYSQRRPVALSMLIHALQLPQCSFEDWLVLRERQDLAALDTVLIGTIVALNLDQTEVATDAAWALAHVTDTSQARNANTALLSVLPELPAEPDWVRAAKEANLSASDLVRALRHPSHAIGISAAKLLAAGAGGHDVSRLLEGVLERGDDFELQMVAFIAHFIWGKEAFAKLLHRVDGPLSCGCRWLLRELPRIPEGQTNERVREVLVQSLAVDNPLIAIAAAETLQSLPDTFLKPSLSGIQTAFTIWSTRGDYCEHHQRYVFGVCCNYVPLCPRAEIIKLLARLSALTLHKLLDACRDLHSSVRTVAIQGVMHALTSQPEYLSEVIVDVDRGHHPSSVLEAILSLPSTALTTVQETLITLFSSESAVLRRIMVRSAATAEWLTKEQVINAAQVALEDNDLIVRNLAVATLRLLRRSS